MAGLGRLFLERICYSELVRRKLMQVAVFEVENWPAGFVAYTAHPHDFVLRAFGLKPLRVVAVLFASLLIHPRTIWRLMKAAGTLLFRACSHVELPKGDSEILAVAVRPHYRHPSFVRRSGLRIGRILFFHAAMAMRALGRTRLQMDVDAFNREVLLFYHTLGASLHRYERGGDSMYRVLYEL